MRHFTTFGLAALATLTAGRAEAQITQAMVRPSAQLVPVDAATQIAALQQQVAALQVAVQALQVKTQYVIVGTDGSYTLNVPGDVSIRGQGAASNVRIQANNEVEIRASTSARFQAGSSMMVGSGANTSITGATLQLNASNTNGVPAATVGSFTAPATASTPGKVLTGSATVFIGP